MISFVLEIQNPLQDHRMIAPDSMDDMLNGEGYQKLSVGRFRRSGAPQIHLGHILAAYTKAVIGGIVDTVRKGLDSDSSEEAVSRDEDEDSSNDSRILDSVRRHVGSFFSDSSEEESQEEDEESSNASGILDSARRHVGSLFSDSSEDDD